MSSQCANIMQIIGMSKRYREGHVSDTSEGARHVPLPIPSPPSPKTLHPPKIQPICLVRSHKIFNPGGIIFILEKLKHRRHREPMGLLLNVNAVRTIRPVVIVNTKTVVNHIVVDVLQLV